MVEKTISKKSSSESVKFELPEPRFGMLGHFDNIIWGIDMIIQKSTNGNNYVVGYILQRGWGTRETRHSLFSKEKAEKLNRENPRFEYFTLSDLLEEKRAYENGKYKVRDGHFVGLNPNYSL